MGLDVEEYVASFRPDLADAVFQWCRGASFAEIAKLSHVFEARAPTYHVPGYRLTARALLRPLFGPCQTSWRL